jgi:hypothetical protein
MKILCENAMKEDKDVVVLIGNCRKEETGVWHDKLLEFGIGKSNFGFGFGGEVFFKCPKTKVVRVLENFPIVEGCKYWQTTHHFSSV